MTRLFSRSFAFLFPFLFFLLIAQSAFAAQIKLAWDANIESDLAGYKVYYGTSSKSYSGSVDAGNVTAFTLTGLTQ
jgi:fibronectin type 3 domain-containing protein